MGTLTTTRNRPKSRKKVRSPFISRAQRAKWRKATIQTIVLTRTQNRPKSRKKVRRPLISRVQRVRKPRRLLSLLVLTMTSWMKKHLRRKAPLNRPRKGENRALRAERENVMIRSVFLAKTTTVNWKLKNQELSTAARKNY